VSAGDLVVGDADGVFVVERSRAESLLPLAAEKLAAETKRSPASRAAKALTAPWLDGALRAAGVLKDGEKL
jgi:regulator of RNase E activity RraA